MRTYPESKPDSAAGTFDENRYYHRLLAACLRGTCPEEYYAVFGSSLDAAAPEPAKLLDFARERKLSVHRFKQSALLPRVRTVIGMLKGIQPDELLDIGTGRGVFLWPLLNQFPDLRIDCIDLNTRHAEVIDAVSAGGYPNIKARTMDVTRLQYPDSSFHTVTVLEVLEHIPDYRKAAAEILRVARRFIILSVPSKPDTNPEHINCFRKDDIMKLFSCSRVKSISFGSVPNHMTAVVSL